ncbi:MAG TPA: glycosyltransferase family 2 protein, partial [Aliiroseovarius sp.]|nr:glycosyltransferase family 2 protein [Aliiroseovarius sp.]
MRLQRKRWRIRAWRKRRELRSVMDRTSKITAKDIIVFSTMRNERIRLPFFLRYYRNMGVNHFVIVDNNSDDGSAEFLRDQDDVSLWTSDKSYKRARFGVDWLNWLQRKYAHNHWVLVVDPEEFLIYPFCDTRPLRALTDWLDASSIKSFGAMLLDMYPKGPIDQQPYREGQNPFEIASWFDSGNYMISKNKIFGNLWIQGGPRTRK